jgi:hypothetical protein
MPKPEELKEQERWSELIYSLVPSLKVMQFNAERALR